MLGGIGMNNKAEYTPEKVVDISNLSREDWLEYRKKGIGGSDVAAIMGISPFATIRDLFYNKTGVQPVIQEEEESNWVAKEVGHRLADEYTLQVFDRLSGLKEGAPIHENYGTHTGERLKAPHFSWSSSHLLMMYDDYGK
jgi:hypothetical protein